MKTEFYFRMNQEEGSDISMRTEALMLDEILIRFAEFLRGCGYFVDQIEHVKHDEVVIYQSELKDFSDD